jgi:hypothetical protein
MKNITVGLLVVFLCLPLAAYAIDTSELSSPSHNSGNVCTQKTSPSTMSQDDPGYVQWGDVDNSRADDGKESVINNHSANHIKDSAARLVLADGRIGSGDRLFSKNWTETSQYVTYGGDLWGETLTPSDVNSPSFGFALQIGGGLANSYFLKATNFKFQLPSASAITGITVEVKRREGPDMINAGGMVGYVDHIQMVVCYSPSAGVLASKPSSPVPTNAVIPIKNTTLPLLLPLVGELKNTRVAPGEFLSIPINFQQLGVDLANVAINYQIRRLDVIEFDETESAASLNPSSMTKMIQIPMGFRSGVYTLTGSLIYAGQTVPGVLSYQFKVEQKVAGIFISDLIFYGGILVIGFLVCIIAIVVASKRRRVIVHDYSYIPESDRLYYEMISDMITQMYDSIGVKAFRMADDIVGLSVDKESGKILNITKDPSEVLSVLYISYQKVCKDRLNIQVRSVAKKTHDNALTVENNLQKFEKYFRKKGGTR